MDAAELFEGAMEWLRGNYGDCLFYYEHEVVEKVEILLNREIGSRGLPYRVLKECSVLPDTRTDLAILSPGGEVEVAVEFKYEPAHSRSTNQGGDIRSTKLPVVADWNDVEKDILRIQQYVEQQKVKAAYSVLVDEGGHFHWREPFPGSQWIDWGQGRWVLWTQSVSD